MGEIKHIGIILDGNRRWSRKHKLPLFKGHEKGLDNVGNLFEWCKELDIKEVTLYAFSTENFNRSKEEVKYLMGLFRRAFDKFKDDKRIHKNKIRIKAIGRTDLFPKDVQKSIKEIEEKTKEYKEYRINFALGYGGRKEIVDAVKKIISSKIRPDDVNEDLISKNLYLAGEPDFIIRPGGEKRLSNFLMWQSAYSELIFLDKLWPEFGKEDLVDCIKEFERRERRFGK